MNMLRKIRIALASLCFVGMCLIFLDVSGIVQPKLFFLAKIQFVPALLSGSIVGVTVLLALTLIFGRVYCSVICPLGILQDAMGRLRKNRRYGFTPGRMFLRYGVLAAFIIAFFTGVPLFFALLEPYSAFGRIASNLIAPLWQSGSNLLAVASEKAGNFLVGPTPVWQKGLSTLLSASTSFLIIGMLAWRSGRTWCNTLCPVGTVLGFLSRFSLLRPYIDAEKCVHCGGCERGCKASCIDAKHAIIDLTRCVSCFTCLDACRLKALRYTPRLAMQAPTLKSTVHLGPDMARRRVLVASLGALGLPSFARAAGTRETVIPALSRKERPLREVPVIPPGASGLTTFKKQCTACQLCVSACPNQVLRAFDHGTGLLQPALSFEHGYCRINCVACSAACPTGAIRPVSPAQKSAIQIGRATYDRDKCIINTDKIQCTACTRNCPAGAIRQVTGKDGTVTLAIDNERCTGCGACEYSCPARPSSAIMVIGNMEQRMI